MKRITAGGVVFDREDLIRVYIAKPANNFGPYEWEFPKGGQEPGERLEQTAIREVREETGIPAKIIAYLGRVDDDRSHNHYFAMIQKGRIGPRDGEMEEVRLVTLPNALYLLKRSGNIRDIEVLDKTISFLQREMLD